MNFKQFLFQGYSDLWSRVVNNIFSGIIVPLIFLNNIFSRIIAPIILNGIFLIFNISFKRNQNYNRKLITFF